MTNLQYLNRILDDQKLTEEQLTELQTTKTDVENLIREKLAGVKMTIKWAGSVAKGTMNSDSYDADMVVYIHSGEIGAGETLDDIYAKVMEILNSSYAVMQKTSAIRLLGMQSYSFLHVDVVPGRFFDDTKTDTWLHRTTGDKCRFKTNLKVHLDTIKDSGVRPLIRLMKLWANRNGVACPTFILELLVIKLSATAKDKPLTDQVIEVLEQFKASGDNISVEDPANPAGNDLSGPINDVKWMLKFYAESSLQRIEEDNWEAVFGPVSEDETAKVQALQSVAIHVPAESKPWLRD